VYYTFFGDRWSCSLYNRWQQLERHLTNHGIEGEVAEPPSWAASRYESFINSGSRSRYWMDKTAFDAWINSPSAILKATNVSSYSAIPITIHETIHTISYTLSHRSFAKGKSVGLPFSDLWQGCYQ
jgi:hypothetical protein